MLEKQHGQGHGDCQLTGIRIKICLKFCVFCGFSYFRLGDLVGTWVESSVVDRTGDMLHLDR